MASISSLITEPRRRRLSAEFEQPDQVLGLLLDLEVAVAEHTERALASHPVAREQPGNEDADDRLQPDEADRFFGFALARQADEADKLGRDRHECVHGAERPLAHQLKSEREAEIRDEGKGMGGIDRDRRQHRKEMREKMLLEPRTLGLRELVGAQHVNAGLGQQRFERDPVLLLLGGKLGDGAVDAVELLDRGQSIHAWGFDVGEHLPAEARDPHHVELVEVRGRDREEAQALEQRVALVLGFLEHAPVEVEPGQFAVKEPARAEGGNPWACVEPLNLLGQTHR